MTRLLVAILCSAILVGCGQEPKRQGQSVSKESKNRGSNDPASALADAQRAFADTARTDRARPATETGRTGVPNEAASALDEVQKGIPGIGGDMPDIRGIMSDVEKANEDSKGENARNKAANDAAHKQAREMEQRRQREEGERAAAEQGQQEDAAILQQQRRLLETLAQRGDKAPLQNRQFIYNIALQHISRVPTQKSDGRLTWDRALATSVNDKNRETSQMTNVHIPPLTRAEQKFGNGFIPTLLKLSDLAKASDRSLEMEVKELQMLLDEELVGNLRYMTVGTPHGQAGVFVTAPNMDVAQVQAKYGPPSRRTDGLLVYGTLRLLVNGGRITAVVFPSKGALGGW